MLLIAMTASVRTFLHLGTFLLLLAAHADAAELHEESIAGTYELLICKDSCPTAGDKDVLIKGRLVLFPTNFQPPELARLESLGLSPMRGESPPNGCFGLEKLEGRKYQGYAGIDKAGLTSWSIQGHELLFALFRSPDAGYKVTAQRTTSGFDGSGRSWGAGVAAPQGATVDKVVLRRTRGADLSQCPRQAD
jgi:hypothetical protein